MQVSWVPMVAQVICTLFIPAFCYLFISRLQMGLIGAGLALTVTNLCEYTAVTIISYSVPRIQEAMFLPSKESLRDWNEYLAVSVPATVMICAEWWSFEILAVISGYLGVQMLAANVILLNIMALMFMFPLGFQEGICSLVGSAIGANRVIAAKEISRFTFVISWGICMSVSVVVFLSRDMISKCFT
jgi:multidrug resistance protein, MATE family